MSKLSEYLIALDSDASLKAAHDADPEGTMKDYGLTDEEIQTVLSGDETAISQAAGLDQSTGASIQTLHVASDGDF